MKFRKREESQKRPKSARHSDSGNNVTTTLTAPISPYSATTTNKTNINIGFTNNKNNNNDDDDDNKYNDKSPYKFLTRSTSNSPRTPKSYKTRDINIVINDRKYPNDDRSITATEIIESMGSMSADDAKLDVDERVGHILGIPKSQSGDEEGIDSNNEISQEMIDHKLQILMKSQTKQSKQIKTRKQKKNKIGPSSYIDHDRHHHNHQHEIGPDGKCSEFCLKCNCDLCSNSSLTSSPSKSRKKRKYGRKSNYKSKQRDNDNNNNRRNRNKLTDNFSLSTTVPYNRNQSISTTLAYSDNDLNNLEFMEYSIVSQSDGDDRDDTRISRHHIQVETRTNSGSTNFEDSIDQRQRENFESKEAEDSFSSLEHADTMIIRGDIKPRHSKIDIFEQKALEQDEFVHSTQLKCCYAISPQQQQQQQQNMTNNSRSDGDKVQKKGIWSQIWSFFDPFDTTHTERK